MTNSALLVRGAASLERQTGQEGEPHQPSATRAALRCLQRAIIVLEAGATLGERLAASAAMVAEASVCADAAVIATDCRRIATASNIPSLFLRKRPFDIQILCRFSGWWPQNLLVRTSASRFGPGRPRAIG